MRELKIIRFDGKYFICADTNGALFAIAKSEIPDEAEIGDSISIDSDGNIELKKSEK